MCRKCRSLITGSDGLVKINSENIISLKGYTNDIFTEAHSRN